MEKIKTFWNQNKTRSLVIVAALILALILTVVSAASPFISFEAEGANSSGNIVTKSDSNASAGKYVEFNTGTDEPPGDNPVAVSWQTAWDSRDQAKIDAWYQGNTGYQALGLNSSDFWNISSDNIIDDDWLNSNKGNGHVSQDGERWMVEGVRSSRIRVGADNVTIRGCLVEAGGSHIYGIQAYPTWGSPAKGTIVEYCTINGQNSEGTGILFSNSTQSMDTVIARNNNIYSWGTGIQMYGNITVEYSWAHDLYYYTGSHNAAASNRSANVKIRRNHLEDGSSAALSIYADNLIHNMVVEENLYNTPRANYCVNFASSKEFFDDVYDTHSLNNIFGQKYNPLCGKGGPAAGGNWTTNSGNTYMDGSPL